MAIHSRLASLALVCTPFFSAPAAAQGIDLDLVGGGMPGTLTFEMQGTPSEEYLLLYALQEQQTALPNLGLVLDIPVVSAGASYGTPGFNALFSAGGTASPSLFVPDIPLLETVTLSFQAIAGAGPYSSSNLVRWTPQRVGTFKSTLSQPGVPIAAGGVVALPNRELLFVGGSGPVAQRYASRIEEWTVDGASFGVGLFSQTTGLPDGRVLFTGGLDLTTGQPTAAAAVYDPATQQTTTLTMSIARAGHGASVTGDGRVLVTGGFETVALNDPLALFAGIRATTEYFDPATDTFSPGPTLLEARALHTSSALPNGDVMLAGGLTLLPIVNVPTVSATAAVWSDSSNSFGLPSFFSGARFLHSAVGLSDGRVLLVGGLSVDLSTFLTSGNIQDIVIGTRNDCQVFSTGLFGSGSFATVNGMQEGRAGAAVAALRGGGALIAGGFQLAIDPVTGTFDLGATATADLFASGPDAITATGSMTAPRFLALAQPLEDDTVLIVGGGAATTEVYQR